jgi:hypothetical protein
VLFRNTSAGVAKYSALDELPALHALLNYVYCRNRLKMSEKDAADAERELDAAQARLDKFSAEKPRRREAHLQVLEKRRSAQLAKIEQSLAERKLRVRGIEKVARPTDAFSTECDETTDGTCDRGGGSTRRWYQQLELHVEQPSPVDLASASQSYECCMVMLEHLHDQAAVGLLNSTFHRALLAPELSMPVPLLQQLLTQLPAKTAVHWLMGWIGPDALSGCFEGGASNKRSTLRVSDGTLAAAMEQLGFSSSTLRELCMPVGGATRGSTTEQWRDVFGFLTNKEADLAISTSFELGALVRAAQEVLLPSAPWLLVCCCGLSSIRRRG